MTSLAEADPNATLIAFTIKGSVGGQKEAVGTGSVLAVSFMFLGSKAYPTDIEEPQQDTAAIIMGFLIFP
jgi:hypothetical protein